MYDRIRQRPSLDIAYADKLKQDSVLDEEAIEKIATGIESCLEEALEKAKVVSENSVHADTLVEKSSESDIKIDSSTAMTEDTFLNLAKKLNASPEGFHLHAKIEKLLEKRQAAIENDSGIDWGNAEAMAFASILSNNIPIRLSGEDSQRGTFSHRHSVLFDIKNNDEYTPLSNLSDQQAPFYAINSLLSEAGVLGFEYGYSIMRPEALTIWEAQFGDFANNAQVIIDQFIASGEPKWQTKSGLVLLLPHGYEGMGPEHSSARIERFLQLCADDNMYVCNPTTPSQFFHLLRRQAIDRVLKPLIVFTPKSLLRHPQAVSKRADFFDNGFQTVIADPDNPAKPEKVIFTSGKLYYELKNAKEEAAQAQVAIVRMEQYYPFPKTEINRIMDAYKECNCFAWAQEEPQNMGAWCFINDRMQKHFSMNLKFIGRTASASPATGFHHVFKEEQTRIVNQAIAIDI
jgi:2-oxoglutarate dehydrogenase E1 component